MFFGCFFFVNQIYDRLNFVQSIRKFWQVISPAQSSGAVEFADYISAEAYVPPHNKCPGYETKQSDSEALVMLEKLFNGISTFVGYSVPKLYS